MRRRRWVKLVSGGLALALAAAAWLLLAPPRLGGSTSYVVVVGSSMEPRLHRDHLVLARRAGEYRVGEVVLYRSRLLGRYVLHRIVGREGDRYVFKGDNNSFVDPDRPSKAELVGRLWLRVPAVGSAFGWLRVPWHAALVAGLAALLLLGTGAGLEAGRRGRRQVRLPGRQQARLVPPVGPRWQATLAVVAAVALVFLALAAVAFARPTRHAVPVAYEQRGALSYSALAPASSVYPGGALATGDPAFLRLVRSLSVGFTYRFVALSPHVVGGEERLLARLEDETTGWRRTLTLQPWRRFTGDRFRARGTLRLTRLRALIASFERLSGLHSESYALTVLPQVRLRGTLAGGELRDTFSPSLAFTLAPLVLRLAPSASPGEPETPLNPTRTGSLRRFEPSSLSALGLHLHVARARRVGLLGGGLSIAAGLLLALLLLVRGLRLDESGSIAARYGPLLLPVSSLPSASDERTIEVASIEDLVRLAEASEGPILHEQRGGIHSYLIEHEGSRYRYRAASGQATELPTEPDGEAGPSPPNPAEAPPEPNAFRSRWTLRGRREPRAERPLEEMSARGECSDALARELDRVGTGAAQGASPPPAFNPPAEAGRLSADPEGR